jgi:hypothetical protein
MKPIQLEDLKNTRSGDILIIGNGPSLIDIPIKFASQFPMFACNFYPMHAPGAHVDYLGMIDRGTILNDDLWSYIRPDTLVFPFARWATKCPPRRHKVCWWKNDFDPIRGLTDGSIYGTYFPTTGHAAVWLADIMGYETFYLVGMDGTSQVGQAEFFDEQGKSNIPHFYDDKPNEQKASRAWDIAWGNLLHHVGRKGKKIINLSTRTAITQLPREDHLDVWQRKSDLSVRERAIYEKRAPSRSIQLPHFYDEQMAGGEPNKAGALDRMGHMAPGGRSPQDLGRNAYSSKQEDLSVLQKHLRGGGVFC